MYIKIIHNTYIYIHNTSMYTLYLHTLIYTLYTLIYTLYIHHTHYIYIIYTHHTLTYNPTKILPLSLPVCPYTINMVEAYTEQLVEGGGVLKDIPVVASGEKVSSFHTRERTDMRRRGGYIFV